MLLHRIHLDPRCREARRDLADPYQMHATLCRAFSAPDSKCPVGEFLWRLEPEVGAGNLPRVLVQSRSQPIWSRIGIAGWLAGADRPVDLSEKLNAEVLAPGRRFRFRLRANPCVMRHGKRLGLYKPEEQERWIIRKGEQHGFSLLISGQASTAPEARVDVQVSQARMLRGKQHSGNEIKVFTVLFDGVLTVTDAQACQAAIEAGIGHAKALGLGLLSVAPIR